MRRFEPRNPDYRRALADFVTAQGYLGLIGVTLGEVEPGVVEYCVAYRSDIGQQNGFFHGGIIGGLAESVMGAAAFTLAEAGHNIVGAEYKINLLSPGLGPRLVARGTVVKPGRTLIVCRADIEAEAADGARTLCAIAQGAMAVVAPR